MGKSCLIPVVLFSFLAFSAFGQFGLRAGAGISDITFLKDGQTPYLGYEINSLEHRLPAFSFQVGVFHMTEINRRFALQPELNFVMQGLDYSNEFLYDNITYKLHINYLQVPVLFRYTIADREKRKSGVFAGPYFAWKLRARRITEVEGQREKSDVGNVKNADLGVLAGFSWNIKRPAGDIVMDIRSSYSLVNVMDRLEGYVQWYYGPSKAYARNVNISVSVGYQLVQ